MEASYRKRNCVFDAIKAFAIFLVVYCHCISDLGDFNLPSNLPYNIAYTFHMPLFFMVSGFFFESSLRLNWRDFLLKKVISLLLPCFMGAIVYSFMLPFQGVITYLRLFNPLHWPFWFLKGLFLVQLIIYSCAYLSRYVVNKRARLIVSVILSLCVYVMPFMSVPRVMIPMFWIGFFIRRYYGEFITYYRQIGLVALFGFVILFFFGSPETLRIYSSANVKLYDVFIGNAEWIDLIRLFYRVLIGAMGSIATIALFHECKSVPHWISIIGASTSAIYILHTFILQELIRDLWSPYAHLLSQWSQWTVYAIMFPLVSSFVVAVCIGLRYLLNKNEILSMLIIGENQILYKNKHINHYVG